MGYTWTDGELITATKLNNTGGGGAIIATLENGAIEYSFNELLSYVNGGYLVYLENTDDADYSRMLLIELTGDDGGDLYANFSGSMTLTQSDADEPMYFND